MANARIYNEITFVDRSKALKPKATLWLIARESFEVLLLQIAY